MQVTESPPAWPPSSVDDRLIVALVNLKRAFHMGVEGGPSVEPGAFPVLHQLAVAGPVRQTQVAEAIGLDASTVSRHVRTLIGSGLITRTRDADDGRAHLLSITPLGLDSMAAHMRARRALVQRGTSQFTDQEREDLIRLLDKFTAAVVPGMGNPGSCPVIKESQ